MKIGLFLGKYTQAPLKDAFDIIRSMVKLHKDVSPSSVSNHYQNTDMQTRFGLTPRECEVVELILAGKVHHKLHRHFSLV